MMLADRRALRNGVRSPLESSKQFASSSMNLLPSLRVMPLLFVGLFWAMLQASCARSSEETPDQSPTFATERAFRDVCIETRCPAPFATCEGERGLCTVDLTSDVDHCGACDTPCPKPTAKMHGKNLCSEGECRFACAPLYADCNGSAVDGCETSTVSDPANCGACGNACSEGVVCWKGACGCPNGFTQCGKDCKKLDTDNNNCGACGSVCKAPATDTDPRWTCGPGVMPMNSNWQCASSSCTLQCSPGFGDCNNNFCGDGCEIDLRKDPANCGACNHACASGQRCHNGTCECPEGTVSCYGICVDLATDPENCGECGSICPGPPSTSGKGGPACEAGKCSYVCFPGFADCDKQIDNGCEADLMRSQRSCGSCDVQCDIAAGQPCVAGKCLTKPCEEPVVR